MYQTVSSPPLVESDILTQLITKSSVRHGNRAGLRAGWLGFRFPAATGNFSLSCPNRSPIEWVPEALSLG